MYSMPDFTIRASHSADLTCEAKMFPNVESSWPGTTIGRFASRRRQQPALLGAALVLLGGDGLDQLVEVLVPEAALPPLAVAFRHIGTMYFSTARNASSSGMLVSVTRRILSLEDARCRPPW